MIDRGEKGSSETYKRVTREAERSKGLKAQAPAAKGPLLAARTTTARGRRAASRPRAKHWQPPSFLKPSLHAPILKVDQELILFRMLPTTAPAQTRSMKAPTRKSARCVRLLGRYTAGAATRSKWAGHKVQRLRTWKGRPCALSTSGWLVVVATTAVQNRAGAQGAQSTAARQQPCLRLQCSKPSSSFGRG